MAPLHRAAKGRDWPVGGSAEGLGRARRVGQLSARTVLSSLLLRVPCGQLSSAQLAMKYLSSVIDALTGSRSQRSGGVYSAVSTQEPSNPSCYSDPIYAPTTHPSGRSLNPAAAVFDRFLQGRLHQEKQRTKCEFEITTYVLFVLVSEQVAFPPSCVVVLSSFK